MYPGGDMKWIAARSFATKTFTPELAKLKAGFLLKEILQRFHNKSIDKLTPNRSMWVYSGHDTTVANLLNTLGLFEVSSITKITNIHFFIIECIFCFCFFSIIVLHMLHVFC